MTKAALTVVLALLLAGADTQTMAQSMLDSIRQPWATYIFVSTRLSRQSLVSLAREAQQAHATLVLRGFESEPADMGEMQRFVAGIESECCTIEPDRSKASAKGSAMAWTIDPRLFELYRVTGAPSFVVTRTGGAGEQDFSLVQGDMALASALKFMAQGSGVPAIRDRAASLYSQAFGEIR